MSSYESKRRILKRGIDQQKSYLECLWLPLHFLESPYKPFIDPWRPYVAWPLRALAGKASPSQEVLSECCIKVFAIFAGIQANACRVFSSHSTSRDKNVRDYVVVLKKEFGALKRQVETALAAHKTLIRTPFGSKVWDIVRTVERRSEIYVSYPPEELDDRSIFEILTLEHEEDFVFNGVTYPTVLAAFKALLVKSRRPPLLLCPMTR